jgi:hypothetical protein
MSIAAVPAAMSGHLACRRACILIWSLLVLSSRVVLTTASCARRVCGRFSLDVSIMTGSTQETKGASKWSGDRGTITKRRLVALPPGEGGRSDEHMRGPASKPADTRSEEVRLRKVGGEAQLGSFGSTVGGTR